MEKKTNVALVDKQLFILANIFCVIINIAVNGQIENYSSFDWKNRLIIYTFHQKCLNVIKYAFYTQYPDSGKYDVRNASSKTITQVKNKTVNKNFELIVLLEVKSKIKYKKKTLYCFWYNILIDCLIRMSNDGNKIQSERINRSETKPEMSWVKI